jgi:ABC-type branched-subunit amino acid transport system substrate-binding protein
MAKVKASGADAVIAWTTGPPIGTVLRSVSNLGVTLPIVAGNGNMTFSQMKAYADFFPKELYFPGFAALVPDQLPNGVLKQKAAQFTAALRAAGGAESGHVSAWIPRSSSSTHTVRWALMLPPPKFATILQICKVGSVPTARMTSRRSRSAESVPAAS